MALCLMFVSCGKITPSGNDPIKTGDATQITHNSAVLWGSVNPSELEQGVEIGIIVSYSENPTIENGKKIVSIELDKNNMFFVEATKLKAETKCFYKAFLNMGGTYRVGDVKSFTTEAFKYTSIDLGLPSGLKWATCNVGASAPEEYGDYFAWGETEPYYSSQTPLTWRDGKSSGYGWTSYKWCDGMPDTLTKYCDTETSGIVDNKTVLDPEDDAAYVNWGSGWRMPTAAEWGELIDKCTWIWTVQSGVNGWLIKGPNRNSIFLPAAGIYTDINYSSSSSHYWSSSLYRGNGALNVLFWTNHRVVDFTSRYCGFSVRPVTE